MRVRQVPSLRIAAIDFADHVPDSCILGRAEPHVHPHGKVRDERREFIHGKDRDGKIRDEKVSEERVSEERVSEERVSEERVSEERVREEKVSSGKVSTGKVSKGKVGNGTLRGVEGTTDIRKRVWDLVADMCDDIAKNCKKTVHGAMNDKFLTEVLNSDQGQYTLGVLIADVKTANQNLKYEDLSQQLHLHGIQNNDHGRKEIVHQLLRAFRHVHSGMPNPNNPSIGGMDLKDIPPGFTKLVNAYRSLHLQNERKYEILTETLHHEVESCLHKCKQSDIVFLRKLASVKALRMALHKTLLFLGEEIVYLEWCSEWINRRRFFAYERAPGYGLLCKRIRAGRQADIFCAETVNELEQLSVPKVRQSIQQLWERPVSMSGSMSEVQRSRFHVANDILWIRQNDFMQLDWKTKAPHNSFLLMHFGNHIEFLNMPRGERGKERGERSKRYMEHQRRSRGVHHVHHASYVAKPGSTYKSVHRGTTSPRRAEFRDWLDSWFRSEGWELRDRSNMTMEDWENEDQEMDDYFYNIENFGHDWRHQNAEHDHLWGRGGGGHYDDDDDSEYNEEDEYYNRHGHYRDSAERPESEDRAGKNALPGMNPEANKARQGGGGNRGKHDASALNKEGDKSGTAAAGRKPHWQPAPGTDWNDDVDD
jgi:hypothetical protein